MELDHFSEEKISSKIQNLIGQGRLCEAQVIASKGMEIFPENNEFTENYALILSRSGATEKAKDIAEELYGIKDHNIDTVGLMGRIYKDLWRKTGDQNYAIKSRIVYEYGFKKFDAYYLGINAASMSLVSDEKEKSIELANQVISLCKKLTPDYWSLATLAEAYALKNNEAESVNYAQQSIKLANRDFGSINSTFRQLKMLENYISIPEKLLFEYSPPTILAFTGHMIDQPDRKTPRFPSQIEPVIKSKIVAMLDKLNVGIGYSSAACGADILFIEAMIERGAEINVILPFHKEDFIETSIKFAGGDWLKRFENVLEKATTVKYATEEEHFGNDDLFVYTNKLIQGQSFLKAQLFETQPYFLGVIAESQIHLEGGAKDFLDNWKFPKRVEVIDTLKEIKENINYSISPSQIPSPINNSSTPKRVIPKGIIRSVKCLMFADIVGFSKMKEYQKPHFLFEFMELLASRIASLKFKPEILNTWGDAIFFVGNTAKEAADFAFMLQDMITNTDWVAKKLPAGLDVRIALHCGPVFVGNDPVLNRKNAYGAHVNRTARIEPVTIPGSIYVSDQFASNLIVEMGNEYIYEYVGNMALPKSFGTQDLYHLRSAKGA